MRELNEAERLFSREIERTVEEARDLRRESRQLRANSNKLQLKSLQINKAADALAVRVEELSIVIADRIAANDLPVA